MNLKGFASKVLNEFPHLKIVGGCFGHQLIAEVYGGKVELMPPNEIRPKILGRE